MNDTSDSGDYHSCTSTHKDSPDNPSPHHRRILITDAASTRQGVVSWA